MCVYVYLKDLERSIELSNNSFQRQLAAEKKKTISSQEEVKSLLEELDRLTKKLKVQNSNKPLSCPEDCEQRLVAFCTVGYFFHPFEQEKERELDAKNIYSNRMVKPTSQKDTDISAKRKRKSFYERETNRDALYWIFFSIHPLLHFIFCYSPQQEQHQGRTN